MAQLLNKMKAPVEFQHAGKMLKLMPDEPAECPDAFLADLAQYETIRAYFDNGMVELLTKAEEPPPSSDEAPKKKGK
jgi:hypothetical protein